MALPHDTLLKQHAIIIGEVILAWTDAHFWVYALYQILSNQSHSAATQKFLSIRSDHGQREITSDLAKEVLENAGPLKDDVLDALKRFGDLAAERNAATHSMWGIEADGYGQDRQVAIRALPGLALPKLRIEDFERQFKELEENLNELGAELYLIWSAVLKYLRQRE